MRVSVCVPTFERPETTRLLIESFLAQDHPNRQLSIADDSRNDAIERLVAEYHDSSITYHHQREALGFYGNLKSCLEQSSGDIAVILGDDDFLARADALSIYADAFTANPTVGFACANLVQVDDRGEVTFAYLATAKTAIFDKGEPALEHLLLKSVHIAGIAFRRTPNLLSHYPSTPMLFPQVKLAAAIMTDYSGMAIGSFLAAARMHERQLGFTAMRKGLGSSIDNITHHGLGQADDHNSASEQHGNVEVMQIIATLRNRMIVEPDVARQIELAYVKTYATNMVNEKINLGNRVMFQHLRLLWQNSNEARGTVWLSLLCAGIMVIPRTVAIHVKIRIRGLLGRRMLRCYEPSRDWPLVEAIQDFQQTSST